VSKERKKMMKQKVDAPRMPTKPEEMVIRVREALKNGEQNTEWDTEEEAAMAYDLSCIFHGEEPENFPLYDYAGLFARIGLRGVPGYELKEIVN
jgi:hypothetical protein